MAIPPAYWPDRVRTLTAPLYSAPEDYDARLGLARTLVWQAIGRARDAWADHGRHADYRLYMAGALELDGEFRRGQQLMAEAAVRAPAARLRARAWAALATTYAHLGNQRRRLECLRAGSRSVSTTEWRELLGTAR